EPSAKGQPANRRRRPGLPMAADAPRGRVGTEALLAAMSLCRAGQWTGAAVGGAVRLSGVAPSRGEGAIPHPTTGPAGDRGGLGRRLAADAARVSRSRARRAGVPARRGVHPLRLSVIVSAVKAVVRRPADVNPFRGARLEGPFLTGYSFANSALAAANSAFNFATSSLSLREQADRRGRQQAPTDQRMTWRICCVPWLTVFNSQ